METEEKYLTFGGILRAVVRGALDRFACVREGHCPVSVEGDTFCRRCYGTLPSWP